jgi:gas vesicle protein
MKTSKFAIGALIGAAAGVVAGIMTAPKSGKETRDDILQKANDVKDRALIHKDDTVFKVEEAIDTLREALEKRGKK